MLHTHTAPASSPHRELRSCRTPSAASRRIHTLLLWRRALSRSLSLSLCRPHCLPLHSQGLHQRHPLSTIAASSQRDTTAAHVGGESTTRHTHTRGKHSRRHRASSHAALALPLAPAPLAPPQRLPYPSRGVVVGTHTSLSLSLSPMLHLHPHHFLLHVLRLHPPSFHCSLLTALSASLLTRRSALTFSS